MRTSTQQQIREAFLIEVYRLALETNHSPYSTLILHVAVNGFNCDVKFASNALLIDVPLLGNESPRWMVDFQCSPIQVLCTDSKGSTAQFSQPRAQQLLKNLTEGFRKLGKKKGKR